MRLPLPGLRARVLAATTVASLCVLVFATMGTLLLGLITSAGSLLGVPTGIWLTVDAIAAAGLLAACAKLAVQAWPIALGTAPPEPPAADGAV